MQSSATVLKGQSLGIKHKDIDIVFENLKYSVNVEIDREECKLPCMKKYQEKQILKGVTGIAKAGEVCAIMGASGAGKTTLLNVIACRINRHRENAKPGSASGYLSANDLEYKFSNFGDFANYVMQGDVLLQSLTVRETLEYVGALTLDQPEAQRKQRIQVLVRNLKLDKCIDTLVGGNLLKGISGGQKKRTSIAFELMSDPQVIMLDEPTSGLDSLTAYIICSYLNRLTKQSNKTIIMTIHQPNSEIFGLFDRLILMVEGKLVYQGAASESSGYFAKMGFICPQFSNPPDYFMSILHHESRVNLSNYPKYFETYEREIVPKVKLEISEKSHEPVDIRTTHVPCCQKLGAIVKRDFLNTVRNPMVVRARIIQSIILGLFIGGVYWQIGDDYTTTDAQGNVIRTTDFSTLTGLMFFLSVTQFMSSLSPVSIVFPKERVVFLKEEGSRLYGTGMFFLSRNIVELPFLILIPLLFSVIIYWMIGLANTARQFFIFYLISFLISLAGNSMGLMLGSLISDAKLVTIVTPVLILPFILFSGFYKNREDLPVWLSWIEYISPLKYSFIAFMRNQLEGVANDEPPISFLNFESALTLWASISILLGLAIFMRICSLLFLWLRRSKLQ